ncbi:MAG: ROK family protein [Lachnospiraceae bacterium]
MKYRVGIDLGGTNIKAGIVNEDQQIVRESSIPTLVERGALPIMEDMAELVERLLAEEGLTKEHVAGIGIGSPGMIDAASGTVVYSNNFDWENVPLGAYLEEKLGLPVRVSNDANCAALGEVKAGAAKDCRNCVMITLGTGVGGGVVMEGRIFEGGHAGGAELGHTTLIAGGEPCTCGRNGCFEAYASATALIRDTKRAAQANEKSMIWRLCDGDLEKIDGKTVFDAMQTGDETARRVVKQYLTYLGEGIVNMVNIFRPDKVLLSGGVCNQGKNLTVPLQEYVQKNSFAKEKGYVPEIAIATLGNLAGILGAAALVEENR